MRSAIVFCFVLRGEFFPEIFFTHSSVFNTGQEVTVMMLISSTVTANAAGLSLFPLQVGQGRSDMNSLIFSRIYSELVSRYRRSKFVITPSKAREKRNSCPLEFLYIIWTCGSPVPYRTILSWSFVNSRTGLSRSIR